MKRLLLVFCTIAFLLTPFSSFADETLPEYFDWRDMDGGDYLTSVKNQGICFSCAAFALVGAMESMIKIEMGNPFIQPDLSDYWAYSCPGGSCYFPPTPEDLQDFYLTQGVVDDACLPYLPQEMACEDACEDAENRAWKPTNLIEMETPSVGEIKQALLDGPVVTIMTTYMDIFAYSEGVYHHTWGARMNLHGLIITGWSDEDEAWITKHSFGDWWGMDGYMLLAWNDPSHDGNSYKVVVDAQTLCGDNTPPEVTSLELKDATYTPGDSITFSLEFYDQEANFGGAELWYGFDEGSLQRFDTPLMELVGTQGGPFEFTVSGPAEPGDHHLNVVLKDLCGDASQTQSLNFSSSGDTPDDDDTPADDDDDTDGDNGGDSDENDKDEAGCGC